MIPGNASAAFIPNFPNRDASALSLFLTHSFKPFSSLGDGSPPGKRSGGSAMSEICQTL